MRIALYCRVSSDKQDNANQLDQLREFVSTQHGWILVLDFVDTVTGSGKKNRPQFDAMMLAASQFDRKAKPPLSSEQRLYELQQAIMHFPSPYLCFNWNAVGALGKFRPAPGRHRTLVWKIYGKCEAAYATL
jgi:hypothetical protein